jgi:hypothetical protein
MPYTLNGTGTRYYGEREHDIGGTYITTKWIVVLGIPLLPLSSWRVYPMSEQQTVDHSHFHGRDVTHTGQAFHEQPAPFNWRQVLNVYAVAIPLVCALGWLLHKALTRLFTFG